MDEPSLTGRRVLVVEDDFYIAMETRRILEKAGAAILGPFARSADCIELLDRSAPDCAVVDINLGSGPSFDIAEQLTARSIPFLFLTGYDSGVIPQRYAGVERMEKPIASPRLIASVAQLCERV